MDNAHSSKVLLPWQPLRRGPHMQHSERAWSPGHSSSPQSATTRLKTSVRLYVLARTIESLG